MNSCQKSRVPIKKIPKVCQFSHSTSGNCLKDNDSNNYDYLHLIFPHRGVVKINELMLVMCFWFLDESSHESPDYYYGYYCLCYPVPVDRLPSLPDHHVSSMVYSHFSNEQARGFRNRWIRQLCPTSKTKKAEQAGSATLSSSPKSLVSIVFVSYSESNHKDPKKVSRA